MPTIYKGAHRNGMRKVVEEEKESNFVASSMIFALHASKYIFPIKLFVKKFSSHYEKPNFVGLIKHFEDDLYKQYAYLLLDEEFNVRAVSSSI